MKKIYFSLLLALFSQLIFAQYFTSFGYDSLNINNWNVRISASNSIFWDLMGKAKAEIPQGSGISSIFAGNFWIGGYDDLNELHVSADRFYSQGNCFTPGPYATTYDSIFYVKYNRVWKVLKTDIDYHAIHWNDVVYTMPEVIENWPGNGNTSNGEAGILAPFTDYNSNGIYDPQNGDYPYIIGDQAIYYILNDKATIDTSLHSPPMELEIHVMAFAFQDTGVINNTFFMHFDIINYSPNTYHNVIWGINTDIDIGNSFDDFIGCDTTQNIYFAYNGDSNDEYSVYDSINGYGTYPPALGVLFLTHTMKSFMTFNNSGGVMGDPALGTEYYNYMKSCWKDSSHLVHHGNGYDPSSTDTCNFAFPEYSNWTEITEGNTPYDRRGVSSISLGNITVNNCFTADVAYVWARDLTNPDPHSSVDLLLSQIPDVVLFANQLPIDSNCTYLSAHSPDQTSSLFNYFDIFPNPATETVTIRTRLKDYKIVLFSQLGQILFEKQNATIIDIKGLKSGIYMIQISDGSILDQRKLIVE
ncbi:MAG: T9SS type A sorting domain-containing protein [Bacteroidota bacterium]